jgi:lipopolysaccharide transport system ATP-binding protein
VSRPVIRVERLSKCYRLGEVSTGTLVHDANRWWHRIRGKPDPYTKIGSTNHNKPTITDTDLWALDDVNFEVKQGEIVGILGRNGAGKSTLLKILSRITTPTQGVAKVRGRLASLLEVGTGFHPELTGRENIFLNGAILGMSHAEVAAKFDEIAAFAGVEKFLDTPVKRYSSGMYVRLAFSVAAHLEPDVLVVDEVLAVGDADFQKRCIDRMDAVAKTGRTVLFVSHNLGAVEALCNTVIRLSGGKLAAHSHDVAGEIARYLSATDRDSGTDLPLTFSHEITLTKFEAFPNQVRQGKSVRIDVTLESNRATRLTDCALIILDLKGTRIAVVDPRMDGTIPTKLSEGSFHLTFDIKSVPLVPGSYKIGLYVVADMTRHSVMNLVELTVLEDSVSNFVPYPVEHRGLVNLDFEVHQGL